MAVRTQPFRFLTSNFITETLLSKLIGKQLQLDKVNDEIETLVSVYSPYRGKVRRVKVLNQSDHAAPALAVRNLEEWIAGGEGIDNW